MFPCRVLVVDDEQIVRAAIVGVLERAGYSCAEAASAATARAFLKVERFDLLLCDLRLGGEDGIALVSETADRYPEAAILVVSAVDDERRGREALDEGACNYLVKPFRPSELLLNAAAALNHKRQLLAVEERRLEVESLHQCRTSQLIETVDKLRYAEQDTLRRLATVAELRDAETGAHVERVGCLCATLALAIGLDEATCRTLAEAAPLHDIGKVGIPDAILLKSGKLTASERAQMEEHTKIGYELLSGSRVPALQMGATLALTHHEHYAGGGYPRQLAGDEIPVIGRITAVVDVYDALTSTRPYRSALTPEDALATMSAHSQQFDPEIFRVFVEDVFPALVTCVA